MRSITPKITGFSTLKMHEPDVPLQVALTTTRVKRPLPPDHPAIEVAMSTIKWDPSQRIDAAKAAELMKCDMTEATPLGMVKPSGEHAHEENREAETPRENHPKQVEPKRVCGAQCGRKAKQLVCACEGSCGSKSCNTRKSQRYRDVCSSDVKPIIIICENKPQSGSNYCSECECSIRDCIQLRYGSKMVPWCYIHRSEIMGGKYEVKGVLHTPDPKWGAELKLATSNSWWFGSLQLGQEAFDHALKKELAVGVGLAGSALLRLWAAAYMQDAGAIKVWMGHSVSLGVDSGAQSWARACSDMITQPPESWGGP